MVAEPSPFEKIGEPPHRSGARIERDECALDVLERRLGGMPGQADRREGPLHPRVGGDDRAAKVGIGAQVVQRLVEGERHRLGGAAPLPWLGSLPLEVDDDAERYEKREKTDELQPLKLHAARLSGGRAVRSLATVEGPTREARVGV